MSHSEDLFEAKQSAGLVPLISAAAHHSPRPQKRSKIAAWHSRGSLSSWGNAWALANNSRHVFFFFRFVQHMRWVSNNNKKLTDTRSQDGNRIQDDQKLDLPSDLDPIPKKGMIFIDIHGLSIILSTRRVFKIMLHLAVTVWNQDIWVPYGPEMTGMQRCNKGWSERFTIRVFCEEFPGRQ
ncbi:hypothetical protein GX51_03240 [Blastomyces parvus]|uniref:Uncharacterized protein n=1 Tax=Blastomyces parvus TaxID=2060905 RepID=A0A2B7X839_9EURO|nr:hypothetical protein GX51_03240 [Blastomyces parvus]